MLTWKAIKRELKRQNSKNKEGKMDSDSYRLNLNNMVASLSIYQLQDQCS